MWFWEVITTLELGVAGRLVVVGEIPIPFVGMLIRGRETLLDGGFL